MTTPGIDVSGWQATTPTTGLGFVIARAGYGSSTVDPRYAEHAAATRAAGLTLGAYWYLVPGQDNAQAVATFLATAGAADLLALDLERKYVPAANAQARDFIARCHAAGRKVGLYASESAYPDLGQDWRWVALYASTPPAIAWDVWQHGSATVDGLTVDGDTFRGSTNDLAAFVAAMGGLMLGVESISLLNAPNPRAWTVPAGTTLRGYSPTQPGQVVKSVTYAAPAVGHADATVGVQWPGLAHPPVPNGAPFLRVTDGTFAGLLIVAAVVLLDPPAPAPTPTKLGPGLYEV